LSSGRDDRLTISHLLPPSWDSNRLASSCLPLFLAKETQSSLEYPCLDTRSPPSKKQPDHLAYIPLDHIEVIHRKTNRCDALASLRRHAKPDLHPEVCCKKFSALARANLCPPYVLKRTTQTAATRRHGGAEAEKLKTNDKLGGETNNPRRPTMQPSVVRGVRCSGRYAVDASASSSSMSAASTTDESEESRSSIESAAQAKLPSKKRRQSSEKRRQSSDVIQPPLQENLPWTCKCGEVLGARKLR